MGDVSMQIYLYGLVVLIISYIIGSFPTALIVGKVFYKIDIREHGSKNLGGTNAGRVLGKKAGIGVILIDIIKMVISFHLFLLVTHFLKLSNFDRSLLVYLSSIGCAIGHSYPIFASFRGGKIVSILVGFVICSNYYLLILGASVFFLVLVISRYVSLSSMICSISVTVLAFTKIPAAGMIHGLESGYLYGIFLAIITLFLIYRHRVNVYNLIKNKERKVKWID